MRPKTLCVVHRSVPGLPAGPEVATCRRWVWANLGLSHLARSPPLRRRQKNDVPCARRALWRVRQSSVAAVTMRSKQERSARCVAARHSTSLPIVLAILAARRLAVATLSPGSGRTTYMAALEGIAVKQVPFESEGDGRSSPRGSSFGWHRFCSIQTHEDVIGMLPALAATSAFGPQTFQRRGNTVCRNHAKAQSSTCQACGHRTLQLTHSGSIDAAGAVGSG